MLKGLGIFLIRFAIFYLAHFEHVPLRGVAATASSQFDQAAMASGSIRESSLKTGVGLVGRITR